MVDYIGVIAIAIAALGMGVWLGIILSGMRTSATEAVLRDRRPTWESTTTFAPPERDLTEDETVLTEANRQRLVEEMASVVQSSLPLVLNEYLRAQTARAEQTGSLDAFLGRPSLIPTTSIHGREMPNSRGTDGTSG